MNIIGPLDRCSRPLLLQHDKKDKGGESDELWTQLSYDWQAN